MSEGRIFVATETFVATVDGVQTVAKAGKTRVREGHPLMKGREMYFKELEVQFDVEQATKAPGKKRAATVATSTAKTKG